MKKVLLCNRCGYEIPYRNRKLPECPQCKSTELLIVPKDGSKRASMSSDGDGTVMVRVIFGVIGVILLISGGILLLVDVGLPGLVLDLNGTVIYINPLSITLLVIGVILLAVVFRGECFGIFEFCG